MIGEYVNKKALSPLIATILLIAFAVSLGTLIMSWSIDAADKDSSEEVCSQTSIELQQVASGEAICYDAQNKRVRFLLKNDGKNTINSFKLRVIDVSQEVTEQQVEADLTSGGLGKFEVLYETISPNNLVTTITPMIGQETCIDEEIEVVSVPLC